jgi:predicted amidohydrolase YtcJ
MRMSQKETDHAGQRADLILRNARIATQDARRPAAPALAVKDGRFLGVGDECG